MSPAPARGRPTFRASTLVLIALILGINVVATVTVFAARGRARATAAHEVRRSAEQRAQALTNALQAARADLQFLSRSGSLRRLVESTSGSDPYRKRWNRLDAEAAALLFVRSHPGVERLVALGPANTALLSVGRRGGAPIALPPPPPDRLPLRSPRSPGDEDDGVRLLVDLAPDRLLAASLPGVDALLTERQPGTAGSSRGAVEDGDRIVATAAVTDPDWSPPVAWTLELRETESALVRSLEHLASDFRTTVILNLVLVTFAAALGLVAFRETRKVEKLDAERANLERLRELELGLLHKDRLASLGRIAAGIAHEINNPLEGMSNYLRIAREDVEGKDWEAAAKGLDRVEHGLARIAGIVRQTLARAGDGRGTKEKIDVNDVVGRTVDFVREDPAARGTEIRWTPGPTPVPVLGVDVTLGQVVLNLVKNACEAQPGTGEVRIRVERTGNLASIVVEDRGPGLGTEAPVRIFDPFYSTKGSTGLGLFLCHAIATDHGGELTGENREGGGARFVLTLPVAGGGEEP